MKTGLIIGKFLPFHKGHEALIAFAMAEVNRLYIVIASHAKDTIPLEVRTKWLEAHYPMATVEIIPFFHTLPHDGKYSKEDSLKWCKAIAELCPDINVFFSSEPYGDLLAEYMHIEHLVFEPDRVKVPISGTEIRNNPQKYQCFLSDAVKAYYGLKGDCI